MSNDKGDSCSKIINYIMELIKNLKYKKNYSLSTGQRYSMIINSNI